MNKKNRHVLASNPCIVTAPQSARTAYETYMVSPLNPQICKDEAAITGEGEL
jgi:hypothetical protein